MVREAPLKTVFKIYSDISTFQNLHRQLGWSPPESNPVKSVSDLEFASRLVSFIKGGSYIKDGRGSENAKKVIAVYRSGWSANQVSENVGITLRQVYTAYKLIESSLTSVFPSGLFSLWSQGLFEEIEAFMEGDRAKGIETFVEKAFSCKSLAYVDFTRDELKLSFPELSSEFGYLDSAVDTEQVLKDLTQAESVYRQVSELVRLNGDALLTWLSLKRYVQLKGYLPSNLYEPLVVQDALGVLRGVEPLTDSERAVLDNPIFEEV